MATKRRSSSSFGSYADGIVLRGMPILGLYPGDVYWVDSNGGGSSKGTFSSPVATLAAATALCTADNGDYVMMKPGHAETITGAGGITFDKAGVSYVGMGSYDARPTFLMDGAATVTCLVTAANESVYNCKFVAGHSDITTFSTITGKGCRFEACHFEDNVSGENFVAVFRAGVADNDFDGLELIDNVLDFGADVAVLAPINLLKASRDVRIIGNRINGDFDTSTYAAIYSGDIVALNIEIAHNLIWNAHDGNACICISLTNTASTGWMHNNYALEHEAASSTPFLAGANAIGQFNNLYVGDDNASGFVMPAIGADA